SGPCDGVPASVVTLLDLLTADHRPARHAAADIRRSVTGGGSQTRAEETLDGCISALVTSAPRQEAAGDEDERADGDDPDADGAVDGAERIGPDEPGDEGGHGNRRQPDRPGCDPARPHRDQCQDNEAEQDEPHPRAGEPPALEIVGDRAGARERVDPWQEKPEGGQRTADGDRATR